MKLEYLKKLIETGREIEFYYLDKKYSITYYNDNRENYISFCEFYKDPFDVPSYEDLINLNIDSMPLSSIWEQLEEKNIDIY